MSEPACRLCGARLSRTLIDLGEVPLANRTIAADDPDCQRYRLHALICDTCSLVQVIDVAASETIAEPGSEVCGCSTACISQNRRHAEIMRKRLHLNANSLVINIGPGDSAVLRHFQAAGIPVLAIDPARPPAQRPAVAAKSASGQRPARSIPERRWRSRCDSDAPTSCLPTTFCRMRPTSSISPQAWSAFCVRRKFLALQVPHLLSLMQKMQVDAFRHDCYSYLSLRVLERVLRSVGMRVFDAERLADHGGSLRVYACHVAAPHAVRHGLKAVRLAEDAAEDAAGEFHAGFNDRAILVRDEFRDFLQTRRSAGRRVAAYGAAIRGSSLLSWCGITTEEVAWVADPDPAKHGRLLPGCRIPIVPVGTLITDPPDDLIILPWPNAAEIVLKLLPLRQRGTQLWTAVPRIARV